MNEQSLVKRTLVLTGKLLGIFAIWIALLSIALVTVTSRMVMALSADPSDQGGAASVNTAKKDEAGRNRTQNPAVNVNKPNG